MHNTEQCMLYAACPSSPCSIPPWNGATYNLGSRGATVLHVEIVANFHVMRFRIMIQHTPPVAKEIYGNIGVHLLFFGYSSARFILFFFLNQKRDSWLWITVTTIFYWLASCFAMREPYRCHILPWLVAWYFTLLLELCAQSVSSRPSSSVKGAMCSAMKHNASMMEWIWCHDKLEGVELPQIINKGIRIALTGCLRGPFTNPACKKCWTSPPQTVEASTHPLNYVSGILEAIENSSADQAWGELHVIWLCFITLDVHGAWTIRHAPHETIWRLQLSTVFQNARCIGLAHEEEWGKVLGTGGSSALQHCMHMNDCLGWHMVS